MTEQSRSAPFVPVPAGRCVPRWLEPLRPALPELTVTDWAGLEEFETTLRELLAHLSRHRMAQPERSTALLAVRRHLARLTARQASAGQLVQGDNVRADLRQTARQIICGFYDLDQRDASGPGHGRMILRHGSPACRQRWAPRLRAGELAGIAMTEAVGGTQVHAITTVLVPAVSGGWRMTGKSAGSAGWTRPRCSSCSPAPPTNASRLSPSTPPRPASPDILNSPPD